MIYPRHAHIRSTTQERHVLYMLGQHERPGLEDEDAAAVCGISDEKMFGDDGAKGAAADDDHVEVAPSVPRQSARRCRAPPAAYCRGTVPCYRE